MNGKTEVTENLLIWYGELESCVNNPICFRDSSMPEMRDIIQIDVENYS